MRKTLHVLLLLTFISANISSNAQWSVPLNISSGTTAVATNENSGQCLVVVGDTLRITYSDHSTVPTKIMFNQSHDKGMTWGTPVTLFSSDDCGFTAIASSGASIHIVWMDSLGSNRASYYKRSIDGGATWGATVCLDSNTKFWPGIACWNNLVIATLNKDLAGNTEVFIKRSPDNGTTWLAEQQISNAVNRSEDPAINILGNDVHLSWNDKRSDTMNIYYRHSADGGVTWGPETALSSADSYTSMVCLNGTHVDVPHGIRTGTFFDVWLAESADSGNNWIPNQQLTNTASVGEIYPFMARDGSRLHVVYVGQGGTNYLFSADGGMTWAPPVVLSPSNQPFIAYTGCVLHVIFANGGYINYMRNPTGNCDVTDISNAALNDPKVKVYPNPVLNLLTIEMNNNAESEISLYDFTSRKILQQHFTNTIILNTQHLEKGIYIYEVKNKKENGCKGKILIL